MSKRFLAVLCCIFLLAPVWAVSALDGADFSGTWKLNSGKSEMGGGGRGGVTEFTVTQDGNALNIKQGGNEYNVQIDGEAVTVESPRGTMMVQAKWDGSKLVVNRTTERETPRGAMTIEATQVWEISGDGKTLTQDIEMSTPRGTQKRKMVFDKRESKPEGQFDAI